MSTYDPRVVAHALDDLQEELSRWSAIASDMLASATEKQRHAKEAVERALHHASIVLDRAKIDDEAVKKAVASVAAAVDKCKIAKVTAHQTLTQAQSILQNANETLQKWEAELTKALAWLARAEARLAQAIREYKSAVQALQDAEYELSRAQSRLRDCQNDENRSSCHSEVAAVADAQAKVRQAQLRVKIAEQEVVAAREEVEQAKVRVACCKKAVATAKQAVFVAKEGLVNAEHAVNVAERSVEYTQAAERLVNVVQEKAAMEVEAAENMMTDVRAALSLTDEATLHLKTADQAEDAAQIFSTNGRKELEHRGHLLRDLNRPALETGNWSLPKNVSPSEIKVTTRPDGKTSIVYGGERDESGRIIGPHGHTVINPEGEIDYARPQGQTVKQDRQEKLSISLVDIEEIAFSDLSQSRIDMLQNGHDSFDEVLNSRSDPITLDKGAGKPYRVIDGRHRIYLARQRGLSSVPIIFA